MSRERLSDLRKLYGGLPADELAGLKARALETGEPLSRAAARHGGDRSKSKSTAIDLNMSRAASEIVKANPPMSKSKAAALFQCSGSVPATVPALLARKHHHHSYLKGVVVVVVLRASQGAGTAGTPADAHVRMCARVPAMRACVYTRLRKPTVPARGIRRHTLGVKCGNGAPFSLRVRITTAEGALGLTGRWNTCSSSEPAGVPALSKKERDHEH